MNTGAGDAFKEHLDFFGEDFHIAGETKRGSLSANKDKISFLPEEFAVAPGDPVTQWATEKKYTVVSAKLEALAGEPVSFDVFIKPRS
jgi:plastocyanin